MKRHPTLRGLIRHLTALRLVPLMLFAGCFDAAVPTSPEPAPSQRSQIATSEDDELSQVTPDELYARIAREEVPGFAGVMQTEDGALTVLLSDTANAVAKREWARQRFLSASAKSRVVKHKRVTYDFNTLKTVFDRIVRSGLNNARWTMQDIDEVNNRVLLEVATEGDAELARGAIRQLGISPSVAHVQRQRSTVQAQRNSMVVPIYCDDPGSDPACSPPPPDPELTCDPNVDCEPDPLAPPGSPEGTYIPQLCPGFTVDCTLDRLVGGVGIKYKIPNADPFFPSTRPWQRCTMGAVVSYKFTGEPGSRFGFLTAAHCTNSDIGLPPATIFYQGLLEEGVAPGAYPVGQTTLDPSPRFADLTCTSACKFADVQLAFVQNRGFYLGEIARSGTENYPLVDGVTPAGWDGTWVLKIKRQRGIGRVFDPSAWPLAAGALVWKSGRITGLTSGYVISTCANVSTMTTGGTQVQFRCQNKVDAQYQFAQVALPGDSGGPVYTRMEPNPDNVVMEGIVSTRVTGENAYTYSPMPEILREFRLVRPQFSLSTYAILP